MRNYNQELPMPFTIMSNGKNTYQRPETTVVSLENDDLICTSGASLMSYEGEEMSDN